MTYYNAQGQPAPATAWMFIDGERVQVQNPAAIEKWRTDNGYIYTERPLPPPPPAPDTTDFDAACAQFRDICYTIRQAIGDPDFKGGFEEMVKLQQAPIYNTIEGLQLANAWSALNDLCTYEGKKIGLGQPEWWHTCWDQVAPQPEPEEPIEAVAPEEDINVEEPPEIAPVEEPDFSDVDAPDGTIEEPVVEEIETEPASIDEPVPPEPFPEESYDQEDEDTETPKAEE